jgi:hypothetical protein
MAWRDIFFSTSSRRGQGEAPFFEITALHGKGFVKKEQDPLTKPSEQQGGMKKRWE